MSLFHNNMLMSPSGAADFDTTLIGNSVWLDGSADFFKRDDFVLSADGRKEFIFSIWVQRNEFGRAQTHFDIYPTGSTSYNDGSRFTFPADDQLAFSVGAGGSSGGQKHTTAVYRDIGWYHVLISYNTNAAIAAASRHRLFVNGLEITDISTYNAPPDNQSCIGNGTGNADLRIGKTEHPGIPYVPDAYFAQACYLEGKSFQAGDYAITDFLDSFTFGTNGSQYVPKADADIAALASTVGGASFCLDFADSGGTDAANLGNDISDNENDLTVTSMAAANQSTNTPSLVYPVLNVLDKGGSATTSEGATRQPTGTDHVILSSMQIPTTGKWAISGNVDAGDFSFGICTQAHTRTSKIGRTNDSWGAIDSPGASFFRSEHDSGASNSTSAVSAANDTFIIAFDADSGKLWLGRNDGGAGIAYLGGGNPATGDTPTYTLSSSEMSPGLHFAVGRQLTVSFGQRTHFETLPSGFQSLNSSNLTAPDYQGIDYFTSTLYEGNGTGQRVGDFVPFTDAFNVANSAMFEHADVRALKRTAGTPSSSGGKKGTWSTWYKTGVIDTDNIFFDTGTTATNRFSLQMDASGQIAFIYEGGVTILQTSADFKGGGLWRNLVLKVDTSLGTAADRAIMYIDGVEVTSFVTDNRDDDNLPQDDELGYMDSGATQFVGTFNGVSANQWDGYLAETIFLDNQFLSADSFGQLDTSTNKWVPKDISGLTLGDQGFYLAYGGNFGTGNGAGDSTGNSNNLTEIGTWASSDKFVDTPTKNFTIFDSGYSGGASNVWSEGNTKVKGTDGTNSDSSTTTFGMTGKVVFQFQINTTVSGGYPQVGFITSQTGFSAINAASGSIELGTASVPGSFAYTDTGTFKVPGGTESTTFSSTTSLQALDADDVIRFEVDTSTGTMRAYFQNEGSGSFSEITGARVDNFSFDPSFGIRPAVSNFNNSIVTLQTGGQTTLASVTTDYKEINQDNLDDTASKLTALAWIKNRNAADDNIWMDRVIGTGGYLSTTQNDSGTAATAHGDGGSDILTTNTNAVQRFLQRGVQVGSDENVNTANESYVLWQWLLGDSATTGSSITTGSPSLATTGIVSDANHFSIVQYTGNGTDNATFAHGLGSTPNLVMIKRRSGTPTNSDWVMHIVGLGTENYIYPHYRIALASGAGANGMVPDANLVEISTGVATNTNGQTHMAYSFKNTPGLCKIGTYTGNSSANGTYVSTGFKPSWLWIFNTTLTSADAERPIIDTARYRFNGVTTAGGSNGGVVFSDQRTAEEAMNTSLGVNPAIDILADGFKLRANDSTINTATTYLYISMADIAGNGTLPPIYGR